MVLRADQATVQEYDPSTGISDHIDGTRCFGPEIVTLSLLSACTYRLVLPKSDVRLERLIRPRSAVVLSGEAKYVWKHGIPARKTETVEGERYFRARRLSITFRTANPERVARLNTKGEA